MIRAYLVEIGQSGCIHVGPDGKTNLGLDFNFTRKFVDDLI